MIGMVQAIREEERKRELDDERRKTVFAQHEVERLEKELRCAEVRAKQYQELYEEALARDRAEEARLTEEIARLENDAEERVGRIAKLERVVEAAAEMADWLGIDGNSRFERLADAFYRKTGKFAPGKDAPAAAFGSRGESKTLGVEFENFQHDYFNEMVKRSREILAALGGDGKEGE